MANIRTSPSATPAAPMTSPVAAPLVGDPGPLGLSGFALTTFMLSLANIGILNATGDVKVVLGLALFYGGLAQLLAGMWEFRAGNTFGATAFSSFGAFWLSWAVMLIPGFGIGLLGAGGPGHLAFGWYLIGWAIITAILAVCAFRISGALSAVLVLLFLTFLLLGLRELTGNATLGQVGGWIGILTSIVAWYTALAGLLRSVSRGRIALPIYPLA
jgi:succinate-acetate transporter protein